MKGKRRDFRLKLLGVPYEKSSKIMTCSTCAHEKENIRLYSFMETSPKPWQKPLGGTGRKNWKFMNCSTCPWKWKFIYEGKNRGTVTKIARGTLPTELTCMKEKSGYERKSCKTMKNGICSYDAYKKELLPMKAKIKGFWLKLLGGILRKRLQNSEIRNLCLWRRTCAHECKIQGFWLKLPGGTLRKGLENHEKRNLCLWSGTCAHEGEN